MSYRCEVCNYPVPRRQTKLKHVVYKADGSRQIERELGVCLVCKKELNKGASLAQMVEKYKPVRLPEAPPQPFVGTPPVPSVKPVAYRPMPSSAVQDLWGNALDN